MLIIWLQGIWLPLHGYSFEQTPLWSAIFMLPLTAGFLAGGPLSGYLLRPDRRRGHSRSAACCSVPSASWVLMALPADFSYAGFAAILIFLQRPGLRPVRGAEQRRRS